MLSKTIDNTRDKLESVSKWDGFGSHVSDDGFFVAASNLSTKRYVQWLPLANITHQLFSHKIFSLQYRHDYYINS